MKATEIIASQLAKSAKDTFDTAIRELDSALTEACGNDVSIVSTDVSINGKWEGLEYVHTVTGEVKVMFEIGPYRAITAEESLGDEYEDGDEGWYGCVPETPGKLTGDYMNEAGDDVVDEFGRLGLKFVKCGSESYDGLLYFDYEATLEL